MHKKPGESLVALLGKVGFNVLFESNRIIMKKIISLVLFSRALCT